ncbi:uncharacterized protein M421DRAFT_201631 [Didymella exigua CBS 183.55]|uniref:Uncharacterized protein n=1 Tax=Didymella exigua CBS 183.55 TaxID=1150837 RepID=A0A6A5RYU0_9PLEO|nr:uncharacterized protein M421DRAFT_201631 [Didymella exigua CBS 183.55]KAF1933625.1 hypothetical protein M421DRAFT_201631 [Didymella exigua CBS 183.55]
MMTASGPIEALWSPKVTEDEYSTAYVELAPPTAPKPSSPQHDFTAQPSTPPVNIKDDHAISPEDLESIQQFLDDNPAPVYRTSQQVNISTPPSDITMAHPVNMNTNRKVQKQAPRHVAKTLTSTANRVNKKAKAPPKKKTQHQRTTSTTSNITPSPSFTSSHRSIDELLASNFYSLDAQEKVRIMLPMLRNLDPRELEKNLAALPCIQAKVAGHKVRVAKPIHYSPPTPEDDDILATKLTFGTPPSPTPATRRNFASPPAPATQDLHKIAHVGVREYHGAVRQREALEKAAALQVQAKKR